MHIQIRNRYRPFTHRPGAHVLLPFSPYTLQIFPDKIFVFNDEKLIAEADFILKKPTDCFVTELNLERGNIAVYGDYFRYYIFFDQGKIVFNVRDSLKISFGIFKKQNFYDIQDREDLREILPIWHALSRKMPEVTGDFDGSNLKVLFRTAFKSLFFPSSPALISEGGKFIRSLLFKYEKGHLDLFPRLLKELATGRLTDLQLDSSALFDAEWRSGKLVRCAFTSFATQDFTLGLPKGIKAYRMRDFRNRVIKNQKSGDPISLKEGAYVLLDRFV
jgi:hypothetical protein